MMAAYIMDTFKKIIMLILWLLTPRDTGFIFLIFLTPTTKSHFEDEEIDLEKSSDKLTATH